jgi:hypothetical protein
MARRTAKTADNGWYALCKVPSGGIVALVASWAPTALDSSKLRSRQKDPTPRARIITLGAVAPLPRSACTDSCTDSH